MSTETRLRRPNGHDAPPVLGETYCPTCEQLLGTAEQIATVNRKLRLRDAEIERSIEARYAREKAKAEALKKTEIELARKDATKHLEKRLKLLVANHEATLKANLEVEREKAA